MSDISSLNARQAEAARHIKGPLLLLAGPGTGKTATLSTRVGYLVSRGIPEKEILAITFTQSAAQELFDRIGGVLGHPPDCVIGTFHKIANILQKGYPKAFPGIAGRRLIPEGQCMAFAKEVATTLIRKRSGRLDRVNQEDVDILASDIIAAKDRYKDGVHHKESDLTAEVLDGLVLYQEKMNAVSGYDFSDLILGAIQALGDPKIKKAVNTKWKYVLVDEYQDINAAQHEMIRRLLGKDCNLWAVGDDDQALYGWRQADVRLLLDFEKEYPGAKIMNLVDNYRCPRPILWLANKLIRNNRLRFPKTLNATKNIQSPITIHRARDDRSEAKWIARMIRRDIDENSASPQEFAVLARNSSLLFPVARALASENIPARVRGAPPFWSMPNVKVALGLFAALVGDWPDKAPPVQEWLLNKALNGFRPKDFKSTGEYVVNFLKDNPPRTSQIGEKLAAWNNDLDSFMSEIQGVDSPTALLMKMRMDEDEDLPTVTLCTIHASKGLEWPFVFVCGMDDHIMPSAKSTDLEEERRIAYVAITRSSNSLFLSSAETRNRVDHGVSPYIAEITRLMPPDSLSNGKGDIYSP